jgi:BirA family biotin operon repressor/biotin-[acetyl-CoA-carboxylase] ligase
VAEAVGEVAGVAAAVKWPNDVVVDARKLAGVLAEGVVGPDSFVILGIGLNVGQRGDDWSPDLGGRAVSLAELGWRRGREPVLAGVLARLAARYEYFLAREASGCSW